MVVERKRSALKYIIAGVITLLVFSLGISLGMVIDNERVKWLQEREEQRDLDYESLQFQYLYLNTMKDTKESCKILKTTLETSLKDLDLTLSKLLSYKKGTDLNYGEYERLQRRYILDNIEYWLFSKEAKQECDNMDLVTILYFYSSEHCPRCSEQGVALTHFKKIFEERVLIFPLDTDMMDKEPMVKMLVSQYDVNDTAIPSIVIEEKRFDNVMDIEDLWPLICSSFKSKQDECGSHNPEQTNKT